MPPFEHGPEQPFFRNSPQSSYTPPTTPTRGFPSIFPGRAPQVPPIPAPQSQSRGGIGGLISSFLSPGSTGAAGNLDFVGMMMNAQKAIQTAQTMLPMIQQFGPLVKNAPAILGALKGLQGNSSTEEKEKPEHDDEDEKDDKPTKTVEKKAGSIKDTNHSATASEAASKAESSTTNPSKTHVSTSLMNSEDLPTLPSVPRMYI